MTTNENITKSIENLLQIVKSVKCSKEDKTDAYLTLFRHLQTGKEECIPVIVKTVTSIFTVVQKHIQSNERSIVEAAVTFLGHCWSTDELVKEFKFDLLKSICDALCTILEKFEEKTIIIRILWCFSHQELPNNIIKIFMKRVILFFENIYQHGHIKSETVNNESLRVVKRFCEQCPDEMAIYLENWIPRVFELLTTDVPKNRETAFSVLETGVNMMLKKQDYMKKYLVNELNNKGFSENLNALFRNDVDPVHVLNVWSCILRVLEESFFDLNRVKVTNPLLKIAEKSFGSKVPQVTLALNNLWRSLIDAVFTRPDEFSKRMEKIFLLPIRIRYKNEVIAEESLKTQWHLICCINQRINDYFEKAVIPLLDVYLKSTETSSNGVIAPVATATTPTIQDRRKSIPKTPKSPFNAIPKIKMLVAEMLLQLITNEKQEHMLKHLKLEKFKGPALNNEIITKYCGKLSNYLLDLTESCTGTCENGVSQLWIVFLLRLKQSTEEIGDKTKSKDVWTPVLCVMKEIVERWLSNPITLLKLLLILPESILKLPIPDSLQTKDTAADEQITLFMVRLLLHQNFIKHEGYEQERFFILYERAIGLIFSSMTDQLVNVERIFNLLEQSHSYLTIQDVRWRLWSTLTSLLRAYVIKTNDVDQRNSFDNNFSAILKSLLYPLKFVDLSKLQEGTLNELLKVWQETFEAFTRGVSLLSGVETNLAVESLFKEVVKENIVQNILDNKSLTSFIKLLGITIKHLDFSEVKHIYGAHLTPTKIAKRMETPMGNFTAFVTTMTNCLKKSFELIPKEGRAVEVALIELLDVVENFYRRLDTNSVLTESLKYFVDCFAKMLDASFKGSPKVAIKMEKVLSQIFTSIENSSNVHFTSDLLARLEPVLMKALSGSRKQLRARSGQFWNRTFAKKSDVQYSKELQEVLMKHQSKLNIQLPNGKTQFEIKPFQTTYIDDSAQFPESMTTHSPKLKDKQITGPSPVKVHGSFMSIGKKSPSAKLGSPKDVLSNFIASGATKNSPKSPFTKSPASGKQVRRKLPINLQDDSCDFVEIKESPGTKKKRLLTEHQKEVRHERRELPAMYNNLDASQDTSLIRSYSQDTQLTQDTTFRLPEKSTIYEVDEEKIEEKEDDVTPMETENKKDVSNRKTEKKDAYTTKSENTKESASDEQASKEEELGSGGDEDKSADIIPSSQTQDTQSQNKRRKSILKSNPRDSILLGIEDVAVTTKEAENTLNDDANDITADMLDEDMDLFDVPASKSAALIPASKESDTGTLETKTSSVEEKKDSSPEELVIAELNMEAKIVVNKLPNKRKRSVPTARRTGHKKRKFQEEDVVTTKENKVPKKRNRKSLDVNKKEEKSGTDVFDFSEESVEPIVTKRKRGRPQRKSAPAVVQQIKETTLEEQAVTEKENLTETAKEKTDSKTSIRPVPQIDTTESTFEILDSSPPTLLVETQSSSNSTKNSSDELPDAIPLMDTSTENEPVKEKTVESASLPTPGLKPDMLPPLSTSASSASVKNKLVIKNPFFNFSTCSPTQSTFACIPSPCASPVSGILKKRPPNYVDSPSPPNQRRVSFQLPSGAILLGEDINRYDGTEDENKKSYTSLKKKSKEALKEKKKEVKDNKPPIYPELIKCTTPIERILPSLTFSRGVGHLVRAQNILTVGDLSSLTETQIEALPIRSPKVNTVRSALRTFTHQLSRDKTIPKSPLVISQPTDDSIMDSTTPTKDESSLVEEAALLLTPSRHHDDGNVKPTSLFHESAIPKSAAELKFMDRPFDEDVAMVTKETVSNMSEKNTTLVPEPFSVDLQRDNEILEKYAEIVEVVDDNKTVINETEPITDENSTIDKSAANEDKTCRNMENDVASKQDFSTQTPERESTNKKNLMELFKDHELDMKSLSNKQLFDVINKLDTTKSTIMSELQSRMSES